MTTLWIGGSSGLAQTYVSAHGHDAGLVLAGLESSGPTWAPASIVWRTVDLTKPATVRALFAKTPNNVETLILGARAPLVSGNGKHESLLEGIRVAMEEAARIGVSHVLHISSVAAVNHLQAQMSVNEDAPLPPLDEYQGSYDIFKRKSEAIVTAACQRYSITFVHLRLSAIFSDNTQCIQCSALALQSRIGAYLPTRIDCNSSQNVAAAMQLLLKRMKRGESLSTLYYYTRPTMMQPVAYGEYLMDYRRANGIRLTLWLPYSLVQWFVVAYNWLVSNTLLRYLPLFASINYLLQVSAREHTFDNHRFRRDVPEISNYEETIHECFARRRRRLLKRISSTKEGIPTLQGACRKDL